MLSLGLLRRRQRVHLLHIGKTGGTALKAALGRHLNCADHVVVLHGHGSTLRDVPESDLFMFSLRDPITRFISGFYSRQRQGRPRFFNPWREEERVAFERFHTPNALALGLVAEDDTVRAAATAAMRSIRHVCTSYMDWFESEAYFRSRANGLFFVGHVETLGHDFARLRTKLDLPATVELPDDPVTAHCSPRSLDRRLDQKAIVALEDWYARDYEFIKLCRELTRPKEAPQPKPRWAHAPPHSRRNLLLVSFDQWRGDWCDPFDKVVDLPNIEGLAAEGWTARRCYTASPMCVPARFSWLTGLHPSEVGVTGHRIVDLKADAPSILRPLQQAGWHTELIGKSHLTAHTDGRDLRSEEPRLRQLGFDRVLEIGGPRALRTIDCVLTDAWEAAGVRDRLRDDLDQRYVDRRQPPAWEVRSTTLPTELYPDVWLGDQAVQCIGELPGDRPWIAYVSFAGPHEPFDRPPPWAGRHASADLPEAAPEPPWMRALPARSTTRGTRESWGDRVTAEATDACRRDYADHLQLLDDQLGALLTALDRRTDAERTDVVVTADHGELLGDAGMLYKGAFLEGAVRVPWIHRPAPCVDGPRGESHTGPVGLTPLLAECMRHQTSDEGFHELVAAAERTSHVVSEYEDEVMVVAGPHKLVVDRKGRPLWATDLENDPLEQENVITAHPREWDMAPCWRALRQQASEHFQNVRKRGFGWMRRRHIERVR